MKIQFAIDYLRGGLWALGVGAFASFVLALITLRGEFLWCTLILALAIGPILAMKNSLEEDAKKGR